MRRLLQLCLVAVILVGLVFAWRTGQERSTVRAEYDRLVRLTGDLPLTDPAKIHVLAIETGEDLHFAWRIYLPPKCRFVIRHSSGGFGSSSRSEPQQFIARVRVREADGRLQLFTKFAGGSGESSFGDDSLAEFLRGRWDEVQVEQLGVGKVAVLKPDGSALLLRLSLPEALQAEAAKQLDRHSLQTKLPLLYEVHIGPEPARP
ncbi:MAG: hypothetical protein WD872_17360 [Pirellulaceae bacterium]